MDKIVTGASAFPCYDHIPRTIVPPLTNGGMLRSMDNHQLAKWLAQEALSAETSGAKTEEDYLEMLGRPVQGNSVTHERQEANHPKNQPVTGHLDRDQFAGMDTDTLRRLVSDMGLDTAKLDTREKLLDAVTGAEVLVPAEEGSIHDVPTCDLVADLRTREGVETTEVAPDFTGSLRITGPAIVLSVID